ncbi:uncharacterized protein Gasu_02650 [Galdieria sulphuraria]|uniref:FAD/NAD(P)-binding domain-containing protein n=1 Tax=Galdieria sulphuraria TaxID=130081 RepID=M2X7I6_GALSU|nr:uncharacterized protein Gasu_02650 [Galdieria sulphuraria]EME32490.1 hypothetical protein Gasu_02650 [Galdieria sulphuraria]|eukprot:XP_005709010.1 hypothetical protein Gasu_02650 [Galdieria sulphuraria]
MGRQPKKIVIVGGGIAATSCVDEVYKLQPSANIVLISSSPVVKKAFQKVQVTNRTFHFGVEEAQQQDIPLQVQLIIGTVKYVDFLAQRVTLESGTCYLYDKLCLCTGAIPKSIAPNNPRVLTLRDTTSLERLCNALRSCNRIAIVGNGGIALELVYALQGCEIYWIIRDTTIGTAFFDEETSEFLWEVFEDSTRKDSYTGATIDTVEPIESFQEDDFIKEPLGFSPGPNWLYYEQNSDDKGKPLSRLRGLLSAKKVNVLNNCHVLSVHCNHVDSKDIFDSNIQPNSWPISVQLSKYPHSLGCDWLISAVGVKPNTKFLQSTPLLLYPEEENEGIVVNCRMETNLENVYAAGDCCKVVDNECSKWWFQMRLWSQAFFMGKVAAHSLLETGEDYSMYFELFTHVTEFFGTKIVLLGRYNAEALGPDFEIITYQTPRDIDLSERKLIRIVLYKGRMYGAVLV